MAKQNDQRFDNMDLMKDMPDRDMEDLQRSMAEGDEEDEGDDEV